MKISILIICRELSKCSEVFKNLERLDFPSEDFEILVGEGDNPSEQRNRLAEKAQGEWLLFLDDDSIPDKEILRQYLSLIKLHPKTVIAGGPSLLIKDKDLLSRLSLCFFTSSFGIGPFKNRYISSGNPRRTSEKELILCNMLIKKAFFQCTGGFNKELYPNEENEFIKKNGKAEIYYQPKAIVYRRPRKNFSQFLTQVYGYGEGRSKHLHLQRSKEDFLFLLPAIFLLYLIYLFRMAGTVGEMAFAPLILHMSLTVSLNYNEKILNRFEHFLLMPVFNIFAHAAYGAGILIGGIKYFIIKKFFYKERELNFFKLTIVKKFE